MIGGIVVKSPTGARAVVHPDALDQWTVRGFEPVGEHAPDADGVLTVSEWAAELQRRADAVKAALATPKPSKVKTVTPTNAQEG